MKDEYDFSNAEQGKFYRPLEDLDIPIYLESEVKAFFLEKIKEKGRTYSISSIINSLIKKDIKISKHIA